METESVKSDPKLFLKVRNGNKSLGAIANTSNARAMDYKNQKIPDLSKLSTAGQQIYAYKVLKSKNALAKNNN